MEVLIVFLCFIKKKVTKAAAAQTTTTTSDPSTFSMIDSPLILLSIQLQYFELPMDNGTTNKEVCASKKIRFLNYLSILISQNNRIFTQSNIGKRYFRENTWKKKDEKIINGKKIYCVLYV